MDTLFNLIIAFYIFKSLSQTVLKYLSIFKNLQSVSWDKQKSNPTFVINFWLFSNSLNCRICQTSLTHHSATSIHSSTYPLTHDSIICDVISLSRWFGACFRIADSLLSFVCCIGRYDAQPLLLLLSTLEKRLLGK